MIPIRSKKMSFWSKKFHLNSTARHQDYGCWVSKLVVNTKLKYNYVKSLDVKKKQ